MAQRIAKTYVTETGKEPYTEYLAKLKDQRARTRIRDRVRRAEAGNYGKFKMLTAGEGVKELIVDEGGGHRVYFAEEGRTLLILLSAGAKRSWKRDWKEAVKLYRDYKQGKGK